MVPIIAMPLHLPLEVLENVFNHLPRSDQLVCLYVCRTWNKIIRPLFFRSVIVSTRRQFKILFRALCQSTEESRSPFGYFIRELRLGYNIGFSRAEFECLPKLCPFLTLIDFNLCLWKYLRYTHALADWRSLRYFPDPAYGGPNLRRYLLPTFRRCFTAQTVDMEQPGWHSFIKEVPYLQELSLIGSSYKHRKVYLSSIETIHASLPHLRHLELLGIYLADDVSPENIVCSNTVKSVRLRDSHANISLWIRYFARKYPYLEELIIEQYNTVHAPLSDEVLNETYAAGLFLARSCHRLRSLRFLPDSQYGWPLLDFLQELHEAGGRLSEIEISCKCSGMFRPQSLHAAINYFRTTLTTVLVGFGEDVRSNAPDMIKALCVCPNLTRLELYLGGYGSTEVFELANVPQHWPRLTHLALSYFNVVVPNSVTTNGEIAPHHKLHTMKLHFPRLSECLFPYLSRQFPSLSYISLWKFAEKGAPRTTYEFAVDLSNLNLKFLEIAPDNDLFRVVKLSQTEKTKKILERRRKYHGSVEEGGDESGWTRWYYSTPDPAKELCKLSDQDIQAVMRNESYISIRCRSVDKIKFVLGQ
ncbi:hypothetical protein DFQ28_010839 [Apophysomyces sp. BC1034]|nr:hypothetical protein DFQ30_010741 [Apophysomyces sp. BC1015]KAG0170301.1 hypothetical protein DFQ29_009358 [Apophysomyces sp. BC1021]KAG0184602.1 hypothetical protein DFQ28_010839 [Apophysomyces sp. BC1034]